MSKATNDDLDRLLAGIEPAVSPLIGDAAGDPVMRSGFPDELGRRLDRVTAEGVAQRGNARGFKRRGFVLAAGAVAALALATGFLGPRLWGAHAADATALMNNVQNAPEAVPAGEVHHVVTTYDMSPPLKGAASHVTTEQWFATVNGQVVTHQTGMLGETIVTGADGITWMTMPGSNNVMKIPPPAPDGSGPHTVIRVNGAMLTPNRSMLNGIEAAGAQPRVVGHGTVNGRATTTLELVTTLPTVTSTDSGLSGSGGVVARAKGSQGGIGFMASSNGATGPFVALPGDGGTVVSDLTIDDATHQIVAGHTISRDAAGAQVGSVDWKVTTDELVDASTVPAGLFTFPVPAGANVIEPPKPGEGPTGGAIGPNGGGIVTGGGSFSSGDDPAKGRSAPVVR